MKFNVTIVLCLLSMLFSSCYKKFYFTSINDIDSLQNQNKKLQYQNNIVVSFKETLEKQNDSLNNLVTSMRNENARLKKLNADEINTVNLAIIIYFRKVAQLARDNTPPCENAANGWFREYMVGNDVIALTTPPPNITTKDANNLLGVFTTFSSQNEAAFINNGNYELKGGDAVKRFVLKKGGAIVGVGKDIIDLFGTGGADVPTWGKTAIDLGNLVNSIANEKDCNKGANANGHISEGVNAAAQNGISKLQSYSFADPSTKLGKIGIVLEKCFLELTKLQTVGHDPWLRADWQLQYYAIIKATAEKLAVVN